MATTRPSACSRRTTSTLPAGSTSAITSSMPTSAATARGGRRVVAGEQHGAQPERLAARRPPRRTSASRCRRRRARARAAPSQPTAHRGAPGGLGLRARRLEPGGQRLGQSASSAGRPATTPWPSTAPSTPRPSRLANPSTAGSAPSSSRAAARSRGRSGAREASSSAPARRSASVRSVPSAGRRRRGFIRPVVTVPVLSSTIVSTRRVDSSTSGPLMSRPSCAPRPVPTSSAVGVARPSAHGQAMISTATAALKA